MSEGHLKKTLTPVMLWGLGVGYVISGMYFGWNLGLKEGGSAGMLAATLLVGFMYLCFSFSYAELACAIPKAGGGFDYTRRALGNQWAFVAGTAQFIEFVFAPPAIAMGIGSYLHLLFPTVPVLFFSITAYLVFTALNIYGVKAAASFELLVAFIAMAGLLIFAALALPHYSPAAFTADALPHGWVGGFAALPFAIWFFLGIEGVANVAEETRHPQRDITRGFGSAILTLLFLCFLTFFAAVGLGGWQKVVFDAKGAVSDSPLPLAMQQVQTGWSWMPGLIVVVGIVGLVASFHGLILSAGRATFEMGRVGYAPAFLGRIHSKRLTPATALVANMVLGILALLTGKTAEIITISVFGALTLYILSMASLLRFRKKEPHAARPFRVPLYPFTPVAALLIGVICLVAMFVYYPVLSLCYVGFMLLAFLVFRIWVSKKITA